MTDRPTDGPLPLGGGPSGWERARSRCTACGSEGLLDEGFLEDTGEAAKGYVRWVQGARDTGFLGGFASMGSPRLLVRAFRCRECNHLELFAEAR
ncbi:hypothetical protein [Ornithinimicrobium tianjinense]|uniref:Uncharacterized protein n=1 Tax=Ornithinimicrobium tianjinense TaxID=1195761 RepID=A0A917BKN1_9MICO|nr:hypothetical protein [Ornithinimicrobium tianjinense]GGF47667.1 hypothetical protein GCM10011366_14330 [Ornithinimicrobium tianjinense]